MNFVFFFRPFQVHGFLSQWYPCRFRDDDGTQYNSTEQYMMYQKALLFQDLFTAQKILQTNQQSIIKGLGRKIRNFVQQTWDEHKERIVYKGNMLKFQQNPELLKKLLGYENPEFVEVSPYDRIWGIGFNESKAMENIEKWGENLLGKILRQIYDQLTESKSSLVEKRKRSNDELVQLIESDSKRQRLN